MSPQSKKNISKRFFYGTKKLLIDPSLQVIPVVTFLKKIDRAYVCYQEKTKLDYLLAK